MFEKKPTDPDAFSPKWLSRIKFLYIPYGVDESVSEDASITLKLRSGAEVLVSGPIFGDGPTFIIYDRILMCSYLVVSIRLRDGPFARLFRATH